jgi:hypothetical protein
LAALTALGHEHCLHHDTDPSSVLPALITSLLRWSCRLPLFPAPQPAPPGSGRRTPPPRSNAPAGPAPTKGSAYNSDGSPMCKTRRESAICGRSGVRRYQRHGLERARLLVLYLKHHVALDSTRLGKEPPEVTEVDVLGMTAAALTGLLR